MAKDKSKTKDTTKVASDDFAKPSEAPASGDGWRFEDEANVGKLFLISPLREITTKGFEDKDAEVIVSDIVEIDEKRPAKSTEHSGAYVWGGWTKGALRGYIGERRVLARLEQDKSKGRGKNAAWVLEDADASDVKIAKEYLASVDPFKQKGAKAAEADDGKAKSGKKSGKAGKSDDGKAKSGKAGKKAGKTK